MSRKKKNKKGGNHNPNNPQQSHSQKKTFKGILEVTRSGMAFVIVDGLTKDIMVKQKNLHTALDKDEVLVDVLKAAHNDGRMEGIITDILKRNKTEFTGTLQVSKSFAFLIPEKGLFMPDIYIPANSLGEAKSGDKAVVKIVAWGEKSRKPVGEIVEILDASDTNDLAMKEILIEAGFPLSFPKEVIAELDTIQENISEEEVGKRKDIRKILTMTIDPVDAKDFDDAISIRLLKNGLYELGVHIADVSHYVLPGTELDKEADKRATSVYLPDRVLPMLPEKISNELCSLRPHEDKLTFSAMFQMNEKGEVKQHWIGRTVIHSDHRFTYEEVQEIIEGKSDGPYKNEVMLLNRIAQTLRGQRFAHGAINFSSQEVRFKLDETGKPIGIVIKESKEAHQLIEEFMLLANKTIAAYVGKLRINKQPIPFPYRVHDTPDPEKLKVFALFAGKFGYKFDLSTPESIASSFNKMLAQVKGKPEQPVLETLGIRTMAKAIYTVNNVGHYGLGFEDYCHFTSPIRRFPDVLVHRVLAECLANSVRPDKQMEQKCKHSSEMERKAMEAERAGNKYKQVEYMQQFIGHTFDGVISGVAHFGFWVETVDTKCEGLISIHNLNKREEFQYNEGEYSLVGQSTGRKFRIGEKVSIRVVAASLAKRQLDYDLEDELTGTGTPAAAPFQHKRREDRRDDRKGGDHRRDDRREDRKKKKDKQRYKPWEQEAKAPHRAPEVSLGEPKPLPVVDQVIVETHVVPVTPDAPETPAVLATPAPAPVHKKKPKKEVTEKVAEEKPVPVVPAPAPAPAPVAEKVVVKKTTAKQEPAVKAPAKKAAAKPAPAAKKAVPAKKAAAKPAAKKAVPAKKAAAEPVAKKAVPAKKAAAKPAAKKAVPAKKAAAKPVAKKAVPAKKAAAKPVAKKAVPAKKAAAKPVAKKTVPAKKAAVKPVVAKKAVPAKKAATKPVAKKAVPAKKAAAKPVAKKAVPAKKAAAKPVAKKAVPAKKAAPKKAAPAKKAADKSKSKKKSK
ncbi:S1 RNA binding domain-containing protein [Chitinophaga ginsengisegetis]|uniref:Ribonuclease R n=1 Tax=Chitinophaga ginsengisegetis TaxID=393003 RepID=A0A1T5N3H4_9BACT|nr:ribonuclease R [Chitinophaga ginsengisegetis]SKC94729.1 S1 RNA binding domain-containing protein [Chitinophaga ginsengisegetis]